MGLLGGVPPPRVASLLAFLGPDGDAIDEGIALYFPAPHSLTGEDVLELQGHGGPVVLDMLLRRVLALGARQAEPGEFTQRAFLNDKLDLAQAEAIADLIDSGSAQAARAALRSLRGEFSTQVHELTEALLGLRMWVEAAIDFPEEEIDFLADRALGERMADIRRRFAELGEAARQGALLRDGLTLVIAGQAECRQVEPAESTRRLRRRHRHADPRARPATCCANASRSTGCRCTSSTPRACATRRTKSRPRASAARIARSSAPIACFSSSTRRTRRRLQPSTPISPRCRRRPRARW